MKKIKTMVIIGTMMVVLLFGTSGVSATVNGGEPGGLTPGFWKNLRKHQEYWVDYTPDDTVEDLFDLPDELESLDVPLIDALKFGGGSDPLGMAKNLIRQAVAAMLNDAHPDIEYQYEENIVEDVNDALASLDRDSMEILKNDLDDANNYGFDF